MVAACGLGMSQLPVVPFHTHIPEKTSAYASTTLGALARGFRKGLGKRRSWNGTNVTPFQALAAQVEARPLHQTLLRSRQRQG